jgi:hypothetical protein
MEDDPNSPETEEDGIRAEALRRLRVRLLSKGLLDPTRPLSLSQNNMPPTTAMTEAEAARRVQKVAQMLAAGQLKVQKP